MEISQKLGISHVSRPVSRDRRMLVMEMVVGKQTYVAYLLITFDIVFLFEITFCSLGIDPELA